MSYRAKKVWRLIASILWGLTCVNLAIVTIVWSAMGSSNLPNDLDLYMQIIMGIVALLILPALTISLVLRKVASREKKQAPHEAPLYVYERPLQE